MIAPVPQPDPAQSLTVASYIDRYAMWRDYKPSSLHNLRMHVRLLDRFAGRAVLVSEFSDDLLDGFIEFLKAKGLSQSSLSGRQATILALWRGAFRDDLISVAPKKVRKIKYVPRSVVAWTPDEVARLLQVCQLVRGTHGRVGIPWQLYFPALIRFAWDTGLRLGDLFKIRTSDLTKNGSFKIIQSKTGWPKYGRMHLETLAAIDATYPPMREFIFPMPFVRYHFEDLFRRLVRYAGIRPGTFRWLRRGGATDVERKQAGAGTIHLGHRLPGIAGQSYLDVEQLAIEIPLPTKLDCAAIADARQSRLGLIFDRNLGAPPIVPKLMLGGKEESDHDFTD